MSTWNIKSSLEEWELVADSIEEELCDYGFTNKFIVSLMLAMDEVIANIVAYAYDSEQGNVVIKSEYENNNVEQTAIITFIDFGKKFNPLEDAEVPDINETDAKKRKIGGLGIFLTKNQTDDLKYSYINASNNLTLIKKESI